MVSLEPPRHAYKKGRLCDTGIVATAGLHAWPRAVARVGRGLPTPQAALPVPRDQSAREALIKKHFEARLQQLHSQVRHDALVLVSALLTRARAPLTASQAVRCVRRWHVVAHRTRSYAVPMQWRCGSRPSLNRSDGSGS